VDKFWDQAGIGVICLAIVIGNHLQKEDEIVNGLISGKSSSSGYYLIIFNTVF
jgi:hypothetical protein